MQNHRCVAKTCARSIPWQELDAVGLVQLHDDLGDDQLKQQAPLTATFPVHATRETLNQ